MNTRHSAIFMSNLSFRAALPSASAKAGEENPGFFVARAPRNDNRWRWRHPRFFLVAVLLLSGCFGGRTPLPDHHYYRLSIPAPAQAAAQPPIRGVLLVEVPRAPAVYVPRSIAYSDAEPHLSLEHYHYHAWIDTPARLLQQELIGYLQAARLAAVIVPEARRAAPDYRIAASLRRFERLKTDSGWAAAVALDLRAEGTTPAMPLLVQSYARTEAAADATMESTVQAFSAAVSAIFQQFAADLARTLPE